MTWRLKGVMRHQQTMALVCIAGLLLAIIWRLNRQRAAAPSGKQLLVAFMVLALATLLATKGRSLAVFFVITLFVIYIFHLEGAAKMWAVVAAVVLGGGLYVAVDVLLPLVSRGGEETLSGRLIVWELTIDEIAKHPWGGFGFGTYQKYFYSLWNNWAPGHAHNLWLQTTFESGVIGAVLFTLFLAAIFVRGMRYQRRTGVLSYSLALTVFCILGGWTSVFTGEKLTTHLWPALAAQPAGGEPCGPALRTAIRAGHRRYGQPTRLRPFSAVHRTRVRPQTRAGHSSQAALRRALQEPPGPKNR